LWPTRTHTKFSNTTAVLHTLEYLSKRGIHTKFSTRVRSDLYCTIVKEQIISQKGYGARARDSVNFRKFPRAGFI
jgi:hypothetical protein